MRTSVVLVFCLVCVARTVYGDCDRPTGGPNTVLITSLTFPVPENTSLTFRCEVGYRQVGGSGTVVCSGGKWTSSNMRCEKKNCGSAEEVINGHVEYPEGTEFGAHAHVVCNDGYVVVGIVNQIYCGSQGWTGRLPECEVIKCDPPNPIANGFFEPEKNEYEHATVITYNCNEEYKLNGSRTASCQANRQFEPAPPTCVLVNCPQPQVENGVAASATPLPYTYMSSITFRCKIGYNMVGPDTVSCDINSKWGPAFPVCNPIECKAPVIEHGEVLDGSRPTYKFAESITVKCTKGYTLHDQTLSRLTCGERNQWSPAVPQCIMIQCPTPQVKGGVLVGGPRPSYKYLDTVKFECSSGYILSGESTLTCDANSQWSPKLPQCTKVECRAPEVQHGQVVEGSHLSYKYLDSVEIQCKTGYKMSGQSTLTCDLNSRWQPELPQCTQSHSNVVKPVLIALGVLLALLLIGLCIYFGCLRKKKGAGKQYTGAAQEAETVALS